MKNESNIITYKINQIQDLIDDVNNRSDIFNAFCSIWQQRIKIQVDYVQKLKGITTFCFNPSLKLKNPNRPSQKLLHSFLTIIGKQSLNHQKLAQQFSDQVYKRLKEESTSLDAQNKKNLMLLKSLRKQLESEFQSIQKNKQKFYKKNSQLQRLKVDYINVSLIQDRDFQKKNKLFLKIKELQNQTVPFKKMYECSSAKYNDYLSVSFPKFSEIISRLEEKQLDVIKNMKNCLINSQLFNSGLGAIVVHETQSILGYLNQISIQDTEIKRHNLADLEEAKSLYQNNYFNPSDYIDQLFKKIEENTVEVLIKYGKDGQYKKQLNYFFENLHDFQNLKDVKAINDYTVRIIQIFKTIFQGDNYSSSILIEFGQLIKTKPTLRKDFIFCLQKYRLDGKFRIHKQNIEHIVQLLNIFLDICCNQLDTYNSKQFMVLSFTYYFIDETDNKIDIQHYVKKHKIWHNMKWWQCSLLQSIYQEHKIKKRKQQSNPTFSLWDIKSSSLKKSDSNQQNSTIANVCFNQLAYYVHNMLLFDLNSSEITLFAQKYIKNFGLSSKMAGDILSMFSNAKDQSNLTGEKTI